MKIDLLFDLDGTISDPLEGIANSINFALQAFGYSTQSYADLAQYIGPPLDKSFASLIDSNDQQVIMQLVSKYRERFSEVGFAENNLYPNIKDIVNFLLMQNINMAVCTSKPERFATKILKHFELLDPFQFISGGDVGIEKWQQIDQLKQQGLVDENTIMIGDRAVDITAGQHSGIKTAGVLWGYGSRQELEQAAPTYLLETVSELMGLV